MSVLEARQVSGACLHNRLREENKAFGGTGGVSSVNRKHGFLPAFLDTDTGVVYPSRFADGRPAPVHLYEGLPSVLFTDLDARGKPKALKSSVISGFVRGQYFYTRDEAARVLALSKPLAVSQPLPHNV